MRPAKGMGLPGLEDYAAVMVEAALAEDIGTGDITTRAVVRPGARGEAVIIAKEPLVVAGLFVAEAAFKKLDGKTVFRPMFKDGDRVRKGAVIAEVSGGLRVLLTGERVALNFLQRLSGIATRTSEFAGKLKGKARLLDTRKTTPCLRLLERYAVRAGGGVNHRFGLFDAVLIKDNHIKAAGSVANAVAAARKAVGRLVTIEVEVTDLAETRQAVDAGADIIMLDNMDTAMIRRALKVIGGRVPVEASGNIGLHNIGAVAATGVDYISSGAITHSAAAVDISMEISGCDRR